MPGFGPGTPFRFEAFAGGASIPFDGAGVEAAFDSAPFGVGAAAAFEGAGVSLPAVATSFLLSDEFAFEGDADDAASSFTAACCSCGNLASALGESLSTATLDLAAFDDEVVLPEEFAAGDMLAMGCCDGGDEEVV